MPFSVANKDLLHRQGTAQCHVAVWMGGEYMDAGSLCCPSETTTILLIGYTPELSLKV